MLKRKNIRDKGKVSFTRYFQTFESGDSISLIRDLGFVTNFPKRMQGRTGTVIEKRGAGYVVEVVEGKLKKKFMVRPIHLKKLSTRQ